MVICQSGEVPEKNEFLPQYMEKQNDQTMSWKSNIVFVVYINYLSVYNKLPQAWQLKTACIHFLTVSAGQEFPASARSPT